MTDLDADPQHHDPTVTDVDKNEDWSALQLAQASYKDLGTPASVEERFCRHLLQYCRDELHQLLHRTSMTSRDYSLSIDAFDLFRADPVLAFLLLQYPATLLPILESAIVRAQQQYKDEQNTNNNTDTVVMNNCHVKGGTMAMGSTTRVHARLVHLPPTCCKATLGHHVTAMDVGKIWQITGTVVRTGPVQMYESARAYKCCGIKNSTQQHKRAFNGKWGQRGAKNTNESNENHASTSNNNNNNNNNNNSSSSSRSSHGTSKQQQCCGRTFMVDADLEQRNNVLQEPEMCPGILPNGDRCPGNKFEIVEGGSIHTDFQEIKIQDTYLSNSHGSGGGVGHIPRSLIIKLQHDLVDNCQPGDEVVVVGMLLAQWQQPFVAEGMDCHLTMAMSAHSVRVIAEKGSSVWKSGTMNGNSANNSVGEMENFQKEFAKYWNETSSIEQPIAARDYICRAVCPKLYGMQIVKLALLITLIGGVSSEVYNVQEKPQHGDKSSTYSNTVDHSSDYQPDAFHLAQDETRKTTNTTAYFEEGSSPNQSKALSSYRPEQVITRRRDQSHLLLVGDPGTGKSQFLRFAAALCPRSVLTTGVGTTSAGLTCAAVREGSGKEFALEAGALVLADKGVCCIDEFGCIREADRTTIHEAMEQQTLSVAKAGIVCRLNCRATIIAVMNPRDCLYDNQASLSVNTGLGTPLLSRFDLIFKLVDSSDAERDSNVTTYLLNRAIQGAGFDVDEDETKVNCTDTKNAPWSMDKLRAYISVVKHSFQPVMSEEAALLLERHYEKCRSSQSNTIPVTVRFLESLIRLSQAHARLMHRESNTVTLQDAVAVIQIMECTAFAYGGFDGAGVSDYQNAMYCDPMTVDFSKEPDIDFLCFEYRILERYSMLNYMNQACQIKARAILGDGAEVHGASDVWNETGLQCINKSKEYPTAEKELFDSQWRAPDAGFCSHWSTHQSQPSISQDHYGRIHYASQQSQPKKRPRC